MEVSVGKAMQSLRYQSSGFGADEGTTFWCVIKAKRSILVDAAFALVEFEQA
jgi:hypothetical protein